MKVRLQSHKSFRHYGGREINTTSKIVEAEFVCTQRDYTTVVILKEAACGYSKGHKIAIANHNIVEV